MTTKICRICGVEKTLDKFWKDSSQPDKKSPRCAQCRTSPEAKAKYKEWAMTKARKSPGVLADDYSAMLYEQDYECAICGKDTDEVGNLHIDHDHETDRVRGLLCNTCNSGLGKLRDSVDLLEKAIAYLKNPPCDSHDLYYNKPKPNHLGYLAHPRPSGARRDRAPGHANRKLKVPSALE